MKKQLSILYLLLLLASLAFSQSSTKLKTQEGSDAAPYPVIYGKKDDGLPEKLKVRGIIERASMAQAYCGGIAWAGTLKIKPESKIEGYNPDYVYVIVPCFFDQRGESKYLKKCVDIAVTKQYERGNPCYYGVVENTIDSKGVPFYCLGEWGEGKLIDKIECGASKGK